MKHIFKKIYLPTVFVIIAASAHAQQIFNNQINIPTTIYQQGDSVVMMFDIDISKLDMGSERSLILTPVLSDASQELLYPPILINGQKRHKAYTRGMALSDDVGFDSGYPVLVAGSRKHNKLHYHETVPYEPWMDNATLYIIEDLCGCAGHQQSINREPLVTAITLEPQPIPIEIIPIVEVVEESKELSILLEFPVSQSVILSDFRDNRSKLNEMENGLKELTDNPNIQIKRMDIHGYASPEGGTAFNLRLSESRANALKDYLVQRYNYSNGTYNVNFSGEDWNKLIELVDESDMPDKDQILSIISSGASNERKANIKKFQNGVPYRQMLRDLYPQIRRVTLTVYYTKEVVVE